MFIKPNKEDKELMKEGDVRYTKYFGLSLTNRINTNNQTTSKYYRVFQRHRLNKSKLIRELKTFIDVLEKTLT